jgi:hypothetical protein
MNVYSNVYSIIKNNGSGRGGYGGGGDGGGRSASSANNSIEDYIIQASGYYLSANSYVQKLLELVELKDTQDLDFDELEIVVDNAISRMTSAEMTYEMLISVAEVTPYNETTQVKLKEFDFDFFMTENKLIESVFEMVKGYLKVGDITGCYRWTHSKFKVIKERLQTIKSEIAQNRLPEISTFRRLDDTICETSLFGSYLASVFSAII